MIIDTPFCSESISTIFIFIGLWAHLRPFVRFLFLSFIDVFRIWPMSILLVPFSLVFYYYYSIIFFTFIFKFCFWSFSFYSSFYLNQAHAAYTIPKPKPQSHQAQTPTKPKHYPKDLSAHSFSPSKSKPQQNTLITPST